MSTIIQPTSIGSASLHATDRADVTIKIVKANSSDTQHVIGIAKTFSFNINKPKTAIEVLSMRKPAGYARNPEDRTFSMNQVHVFEEIERMSDLTESTEPFEIDIEYTSATDELGRPLPNATVKIMKLIGVEFESASTSVDANGTEFTVDYSGKFRSMEVHGGTNSWYNSAGTVLTV
jgi:hypothetical protein